MKSLRILTFVVGLIIANSAFSQCDTTTAMCVKHIGAEYISDGQQYKALLLNDEIAEFKTTLYGNSTYRIAACSGITDGNLIFRVFDQERNQLFSNEEFRTAPYWDFEVKNTLDCTIEAQLDPTSSSSGCAVLLIGFKQ